jgi:hypothetical protein
MRICQRCGKKFRPRLWCETNKYCSRICAGTSKASPSAPGTLQSSGAPPALDRTASAVS